MSGPLRSRKAHNLSKGKNPKWSAGEKLIKATKQLRRDIEKRLRETVEGKKK